MPLKANMEALATMMDEVTPERDFEVLGAAGVDSISVQLTFTEGIER